jgi:hypothetical protein
MRGIAGERRFGIGSTRFGFNVAINFNAQAVRI